MDFVSIVVAKSGVVLHGKASPYGTTGFLVPPGDHVALMSRVNTLKNFSTKNPLAFMNWDQAMRREMKVLRYRPYRC